MKFPKELSSLLTDKIGFTEQELDDYFMLKENEKKWILSTKQWLETATYKAMRELCEQKGGAYNPNPPTFYIPKPERRMAEAPTVSNHTDTSPPTELQPAKTTVKLSQLQFGVFSPRKTSRKWIEHLKEAIQSEGAESFPLPKVRVHPDAHKMSKPCYQIVDGEHFCQALKELDVETVKVQVLELTDEEADYQAMRYNQIHGKPLEPIEEGRHLKKMMDKYGLSQEQIAKKFKRSQPWVSRRLALLKVGDDVIQRVITSTHAQEIATAPEEVRGKIVEKVEKEGLSTRETKAVVEAIKEAPEKKKEILTRPGVPPIWHCGFPDCPRSTYYPTFYLENIPVCPYHNEQIQKDQSLLEKLKEKPSLPKKVEAKEYKPKDKWEHRAARMKVSPSKMDEAVYLLAKQNQELKDMGWEVIPQKVYVLTVSDLTLKRGKEEKAFFNDYEETHKNKRDADVKRREILMMLYPDVTAIGIDYNARSKPTDILKEILDEART